MARMSLPTPTLHTARLRLRPFNDADANALFALHSSAHVLRYWDAPPWSERVRAEIEQFFVAAVAFEQKDLEILGWDGVPAAEEIVRDAAGKQRRRHATKARQDKAGRRP